MLEEVQYCNENITHVDKVRARRAYACSMSLALSVGDTLADLWDENNRMKLQKRLFQYVLSAHELAYNFAIYHGEPISNGAMTPDNLASLYSTGTQLNEAIKKFLRLRYPHLVPA